MVEELRNIQRDVLPNGLTIITERDGPHSLGIAWASG